MNPRTARRREGVIALTHTEIMMILATVILILLLAKNLELRQLRVSLKKDSSASAQMLRQIQQQKVELTEKVTGQLIATGAIPEHAEDFRVRGDQVTAAISRLTGQHRELSVVLADAGKIADDEQFGDVDMVAEVRELIEENERNAEIARATKDALAMDESYVAGVSGVEGVIEGMIERGEDADELRAENEKLQEANAVLRQSLSEKLSPPGKARDEVGFLPCWKGPGFVEPSGKKKYYFSFRVLYDVKNRYYIKPHKDWTSGVKVVNDALNGELRVIKKHPSGWISQEEFSKFAEKVTQAQKQMYDDNKCKLAIHISNNANGDVINYINGTGFYPVYFK